MITYLAIKNVSVIENVSFELTEGLTVLTGETGSGKSVLVGALKLLLGERFQKNMLRDGAERLMVEGIFNDVSSVPAPLKEQFNIDDELIIRREADITGKNRVFINSMLSTVSQLREFAPYLADIHGQHEHQTLLDESKHLELIDHLVSSGAKEAYLLAYRQYRQVKTRRDTLLADFDDVKKREDIVKFQLNEISSAEIDLNKDADLEERISFMTHIEKIQNASAVSLDALTDGEINAAELISKSVKALSPLSGMLQEIAHINNRLNEALDIITEDSRMLAELFGRHEVSPEELDKLVQRKYLLQDLIKKYSADDTLAGVLGRYEELKNQLDNFENSDELLIKLDKELESRYTEAKIQADLLNGERRRVADDVSARIVSILSEMELPHCMFLAEFKIGEHLDAFAGAEVRFCLSLNVGFEPAPLAQVASGGEISRVMLALKEVFSDVDGTPTLLFDEIDTGISGRTAKKVAQKLHNLAKKKQIIIITHLPVAAAAGNAHFHIAKRVEDNVTKTSITPLNSDERKKIIASMIAGEVTASSVKQAEELLAT